VIGHLVSRGSWSAVGNHENVTAKLSPGTGFWMLSLNTPLWLVFIFSFQTSSVGFDHTLEMSVVSQGILLVGEFSFNFHLGIHGTSRRNFSKANLIMSLPYLKSLPAVAVLFCNLIVILIKVIH
jgi:hypothetical protein